MLTRTRTTRLTFRRSFLLPGDAAALPAGDYDLTIEEERLEPLSFEAWRRTGTWLVVRGSGATAGRVEMRPVTEQDIDKLIAMDMARDGGAAPDPLEDRE